MIVPHTHLALHTRASHVDSLPIREGDAPHRVVQTMRKTLAASPTGVGLAANQVGSLHRIILVCMGNRKHGATVMVNPVITRKSVATTWDMEGCLSYPGYECRVQRHNYVEAEWQMMDGTRCFRRFTGLVARIVQHEVDHLDGVCIWTDTAPA